MPEKIGVHISQAGNSDCERKLEHGTPVDQSDRSIKLDKHMLLVASDHKDDRATFFGTPYNSHRKIYSGMNAPVEMGTVMCYESMEKINIYSSGIERSWCAF